MSRLMHEGDLALAGLERLARRGGSMRNSAEGLVALRRCVEAYAVVLVEEARKFAEADGMKTLCERHVVAAERKVRGEWA